ncbi:MULTISPECIES: PLP-dependent aminotransferase family protein [Pseudoalteromonas]|uniref:aminotransferase-like domain-containing protein n=1 Tax=Pseudoalteromonas TaxID=53246 RepID=UPI0019D1B650|nr:MULTISPECIES: PLP-dependent aminotransferase family protein [Pseudoalteromonas]MBR8841506.1 PLP-dependent aminotransferase family protein [Pseudoalteromonas sp. JC3]UDM61299.1 PLP-dependent aminotransferase family protein [Pseudoalteromonas piscicida]WJE07528.1 PLP-dependent aminotransferase family protein [Pseudoalteromonas sp. JC3]
MARKFITLSEQVIAEINAGERQCGEKMTSLRIFAKQHGVSMSTAIRTYEELQDNGFLASQEKSGFYICKPKAKNSDIDFATFTSEVKFPKSALRPSVVGLNTMLSTVQVAPELMPINRLTKFIKQAFDSPQYHHFHYPNAMGLRSLRENLTKHFKQKGLALNPDNLVVTGGCIQAVMAGLQAVTKAGDCVVVPSPCYQGLLQLLATLQLKVIEIPTTPEGLDLEALEQVVTTQRVSACLLTANHQNPTGHSLSVQQKAWLADFAVRYQVAIIEDDVFGELSHNHTMPLPIKAWDKAGYVIWCSSVSKTLAPGLQVGWCEAGRYQSQVAALMQAFHGMPNQCLQMAVSRFIETGHYQRHLRTLNRTLAAHCFAYQSYLKSRLPKGCKISSPQGGMALWLKLPNIDCDALALRLAELGVEIRQGSLFTSRELYQDHLRINCGWPLDVAKPWLDKLCDWVLHNCAKL